MIARIWHGWTTEENASLYESLLRNDIFPSIKNKNINGYKKISLLKHSFNEEVEFVTIMIFDNLDSVKDFAGENYEKSYVPLRARQLLSRHDEIAQHYEIINEIEY